MNRILFAAKTHLDGIMHEQPLFVGSSVFAGHVVGSQPMKKGGRGAGNLSNDK